MFLMARLLPKVRLRPRLSVLQEKIVALRSLILQTIECICGAQDAPYATGRGPDIRRRFNEHAAAVVQADRKAWHSWRESPPCFGVSCLALWCGVVRCGAV